MRKKERTMEREGGGGEGEKGSMKRSGAKRE